jgi:hypothetical protein
LRNIIPGESRRRLVLQKQRSCRLLHSCLFKQRMVLQRKTFPGLYVHCMPQKYSFQTNPFSGCQ